MLRLAEFPAVLSVPPTDMTEFTACTALVTADEKNDFGNAVVMSAPDLLHTDNLRTKSSTRLSHACRFSRILRPRTSDF